MQLSRKEQWLAFYIVNGSLILLPILFILYDKFVRETPIASCFILEKFQFYCAGCGGTRAFEALCRFDILESLKYHPVVLYFAIMLIIYEVVMIKGLIKKEERKVFFNLPVTIIFMILLVSYMIFRNVLLYNGIDILGNVITP